VRFRECFSVAGGGTLEVSLEEVMLSTLAF
jgi:hypothetical protein